MPHSPTSFAAGPAPDSERSASGARSAGTADTADAVSPAGAVDTDCSVDTAHPMDSVASAASATWAPRILHLDVDAFLASVEQARFPALRGRPVVVGGPPTSRNLVMSCSYEARRFGIRSGMHLSEAARRCPAAVFTDGSAKAAAELREQLAFLLMRFTPRVEVTSIDDFLVDLTGTRRLHGSAFDVAGAIRSAVWDELCLPVSIGVGTTCLLARLAGKLAKPGGVAEILPGYEERFLAALPVEQLPGVGHTIGAHLARFAIRTVGELRLVPREVLFASFGRDGLVLFDRARGRDPRRVEPTYTEGPDGKLAPRPPKSLARETTFEPEEGRREFVEAMLGYLVERAATRLREFGVVARSVEVRIRYVETRPGAPAWSASGTREPLSHKKRRVLPGGPTDSTAALGEHARALLRELPWRRALVKRVGVTLVDLRPAGGWQGWLFDVTPSAGAGAGAADARPLGADEPSAASPLEPSRWNAPDARGGRATRTDRNHALDRVLDELRARQGFGRVLRGTQLALRETHALSADGFRLRTPSLNQ